MMKILLVEDDEDHAELAMATIAATGLPISVTHASSAEDILRILQNDRQALTPISDAILLDIKMPRVDGITLLKKLKENAITQDIPVYMTTTSSRQSDQSTSLSLGAHGYLIKPFLIEDITCVYANHNRGPAQ